MISENLLELASEQRLNILLNLSEKEGKISELAKKLNATVPEVHRNFRRLEKTGLIVKKPSGTYVPTVYGQTVCHILPSISFMIKNKQFFKEHSIGLESKFIQRTGALENSEQIKGFVKVTEKWREIYENSQKYIYNMLVEASYSTELVDMLVSKLKNNIKIKSIFAENAQVTKERSQIIKKDRFKKFLKDDVLKRKMKKKIKVVVVLNELEAGLSFPFNNEEPDLSKMFYSKDRDFHEWCMDYFKHSWDTASTFREERLV